MAHRQANEVQGELDFGWEPPPPKQLPDRLIVVLRWDAALEMVVSEWPDTKLSARFRDWKVALDIVLHPLNSHVDLRVRT